MIRGNDINLYKKYNDILQGNKSYKKPSKFNQTSFIVCHYAGEVEYKIGGFLEKNKDTLSKIICDTF